MRELDKAFGVPAASDDEYARYLAMESEEQRSAWSLGRIAAEKARREGHHLNWLFWLFAVLLVLWAIGMLVGWTLNGGIHMLPVIALIVLLIRVIVPAGGRGYDGW